MRTYLFDSGEGLYGHVDEPLNPDRQTVVIADDSDINRSMLMHMLKDDYDVVEVKDGTECLDLLRHRGNGISLLLLDIVMPGADGFEVLASMKEMSLLDTVPVIMITAHDSASNIKRAYELGAFDYVSRPFDKYVVRQRIGNAVKLYGRQRRLQQEVARQSLEKRKTHRLLADISGSIIGYGSGESNVHLRRTAWITSLLLDVLVHKSDKYFLPLDLRDDISAAAALHDIGKIGIERSVLNKPGKLTKDEFEKIKEHTVIGESIIKNIENYDNEPLLQVAAEICRWHHERYDGKGYPDGLKGDEIPVSAQVVAVADVYDALVSDRVYSPAVSPETAFKMIKNGECGTFSPLMIECLEDIMPLISE